MGETDQHRDAMVRIIELLKSYFAGQPVYVSGDLLLYYEQGNPKKFVVPDAFIAKGLQPHQRRIYRLWLEGVVPQLVIETTSKTTKKKDVVEKAALYAKLGVKEYFLHDPTREYLEPPLQGHRWHEGSYQRIAADTRGRLFSEELQLWLCDDAGELNLYRPSSDERLLTHRERAAEETEARLRETEARLRAEAEVARLRAELEQRKAAGSD
jgi:Uma2 family endonuclease